MSTIFFRSGPFTELFFHTGQTTGEALSPVYFVDQLAELVMLERDRLIIK